MIDPAKSEQEIQVPPIKPVPPIPAEFHSGATGIAHFTPHELALWQSAREYYKDELRDYEKVVNALNKVKVHIFTTISRRNIIVVDSKKPTHSILQALKSAIAPSLEMEKQKAIQDYSALKPWNKKEKIETWIRRWENTYREARYLNLPEVQGDKPLKDFLTGLSTYSEAYSYAARAALRESISKGKTLTMEAIIQDFRLDALRFAPISRPTIHHSAF